MLRKITLTATSVVTNFGTTAVLSKKCKRLLPSVFDLPDADLYLTKKEIVIKYAKTLGVTIGITVVAGIVTQMVTTTVDNVIFPNIEGPY